VQRATRSREHPAAMPRGRDTAPAVAAATAAAAVGQFVIEPAMSACVATTHGVAGELVEMPRGVKRSRDAGVYAV
jgi:hypothetical protein